VSAHGGEANDVGRRRRDVAVDPASAERDAAGARGQMTAACGAVGRELRELERVMERRLRDCAPAVRETSRPVA
jgi:hypothetical protein